MKKTMLVPAVAALLFSVGSAHGDDPPPVREGLWSNHTETIEAPGNRKTEKEKPSAVITPTTSTRELKLREPWDAD